MKLIPLKTVLFLMLVIFLQCTLHPFSGDMMTDTIQVDIKSLRKQFPNARAVYLLNEADLDYRHGQDGTFTIIKRHVMIAILNERGYQYANVIIPFDSETRISKIQARTRLNDGRSFFLNQKQIYESNLFPQYMFYSDIHAKRFTMPAVEPGCIIEYQWEQRRAGFNLFSRWEFQKQDPVLCSRYRVTTDLKTTVKAKIYATKADIRKEYIFRGRKTTEWELKNIPPLNTEISMGKGYQEVPGIMFSPPQFDTWQDVNDWYYDLFYNQIRFNPHMKNRVADLTENTVSGRETLKHLFSYVQGNIRYVAIEIGMGGYRPQRANEVFSQKYGDCKDMVLLLVALAKEAGLAVSPVLISNYMHGPADTSVVSHAHFNHVIAYARLKDGTEIWMDPTDKTTAFGQLPWYDQNRYVLIVNSDEGKLLKSPVEPAEENSSIRHWTMEIGANGIAEGHVRIQLKGALASEMRAELQEVNPVNIESNLSRNLIEAFPLTRIDDLQLKGLDIPEQPLEMRMGFKTDAIDIQDENYIAIQPGLFSGFSLHKVFYTQKRTFDVALKYPVMIHDYMRISYPNSWIAISGISSDSLKSAFGSYQCHMDVNQAGTAFYRRVFKLDQTHIPVEDYSVFRDFLFQTFQMDRNLVLYQAY